MQVPLGSARAGSNPARVEYFFFLEILKSTEKLIHQVYDSHSKFLKLSGPSLVDVVLLFMRCNLDAKFVKYKMLKFYYILTFALLINI